MRKHDDQVLVRLGRQEDPIQFIWRDQLWRVLAIEGRWVESGSWWTGPAVRAARGGSEPGAGDGDPMGPTPERSRGSGASFFDTSFDDTSLRGAVASAGVGAALIEDDVENDLLCELEVWRVEAANGMAGSRGVYELAHALHQGTWRLRGVMD